MATAKKFIMCFVMNSKKSTQVSQHRQMLKFCDRNSSYPDMYVCACTWYASVKQVQSLSNPPASA